MRVCRCHPEPGSFAVVDRSPSSDSALRGRFPLGLPRETQGRLPDRRRPRPEARAPRSLAASRTRPGIPAPDPVCTERDRDCTAIHTGDRAIDTITYTAARAHLAHTMDRVCADHEPLIITRNGEQSVVMMSLDDYKALEETAYLLRAPANARRLLAAIASLGRGKGKARRLAE